MPGRALLADVLAERKLTQLLNHPRANNDAEKQRRETCEGSPERYVLEKAKGCQERVLLRVGSVQNLEKKPVEHRKDSGEEFLERALNAGSARAFEEYGIPGLSEGPQPLPGFFRLLEKVRGVLPQAGGDCPLNESRRHAAYP